MNVAWRSNTSTIKKNTFAISGTEFSTLLREGKQLRPENPLNQEAGWASKDGSVKVPSYQVAEEMQEIGAELAILQLSKLYQVCIDKLILKTQILITF